MGAVYAAHDPELDRTVALKIVPRRGDGSVSLKDEAQTLARFSHPNVVAVHDVGELGGGVFIAMEFVEGKTLRAWAAAHRDQPRALTRVMREAGKGLAAAHAQGLVHLDIKPDNIMIADDGRVLVLDFGLAKPQEHTGAGTQLSPAGTPAYMAPEQHRQLALDHRADQFSFCVTWLECVSGRRPFPGDTPSAITRAILDGELDLPPRPAAMPRKTWDALLRGVSSDPQARWPDMAALLQSTTPPTRARVQTMAAVLLAGALGAAGAWAVSGSDARCRGAAKAVEAVWSSAEADAVSRRTGTGVSARRLGQVAERLGVYAQSLAEGYREACLLAPEDRPRQVCLDARLEQLRAARDVAREGATESLSALFEALGDARVCRRADEEALYREVSDPERGQAVLQGLARGRVWVKAGRHGDARPELEAVIAEAQRLGWRAVEAAARAQLAEVLAYAGEKDAVHEQLQASLRLAAAAGSDAVTFDVLRRQIHEHSLAGDVVSVRALVPAVEAAAARAGESGASIAVARGNVLQLTGDYAGAEAAYRDALGLEPDASLRVRVQSNLGGIALYRGEYVAAKALFEEALPICEQEHGELAVATLKLEANLADADQQLGNLDPALERYASALARYEEAGSAGSRPAQHLALNYAQALLAAGDLPAAVALGEPAARRMLELHGDSHVFSIAARDLLNALAYGRGEFDAALAGSRTLLADLDTLLGKDAPLSAFIRIAIARAAQALGRTEVGLEALAKAEPLFVQLHPEHPARTTVLRLRAELLLDADNPSAARVAAEAAVRGAANPSVPPVERGRAYLVRARASLADGVAQDGVRADLERARDAFAAAPGSPEARADEVRALLRPPR